MVYHAYGMANGRRYMRRLIAANASKANYYARRWANYYKLQLTEIVKQ